MNHNFNVPNCLTLLRVLLLPPLIVCFFKNSMFWNVAAFIIFIFCSITDYLDGVYARKKNKMTKFGQMFDPLADKLFVTTTIMLILGFDLTEKYNIVAMIVIVCREIVVSSIRSNVDGKTYEFKTSMMSKIKTYAQMLALSSILLNNVYNNYFLLIVSTIFLWTSALLSIISGTQYFLKYKNIILEK